LRVKVGQTVRVRPRSPVALDWEIPAQAQGTVTCTYRLLREGAIAPERVDVRFSPNRVVWGARESEFEVIEDGQTPPASAARLKAAS